MTTPNSAGQFDEQVRKIAENAALPFTPPLVEYASNPQGFYFHWSKLYYACGMSDPGHFPPLSGSLSSQDQDAVRRYVKVCRELATYSLLNHGGGVTVSWTPEAGEAVSVDQPAKEALRGFAVLFRQIHSDQNEPASFKVVRSILTAASASTVDGFQENRMGIVKEWSRARAQLLQHSLSDLCNSKMAADRIAPPVLAEIQREYTPVQLISLFNYGEYIHWGDRRNDHAALFQDAVGGALSEFSFQEILVGFSHFYFGYAKLLETAFGKVRSAGYCSPSAHA